MHKMTFLEPVPIASGKDLGVRDIEDLQQALQFLRDWPANRRGPVFDAAYNACTAARNGYLGVEEARKSLSGFARITGILRQKTQPVSIAQRSAFGTAKAARANP